MPAPPMPATWRRLPLSTPEYEWFGIEYAGLPRALSTFRILVRHERNDDVIVATVFAKRDDCMRVFNEVIAHYHVDGKVKFLARDVFLRRFYLPRLFTTYSYDRKAFLAALMKELHSALLNVARNEMRLFLHEKKRIKDTQRARMRAVKKPRVFRDGLDRVYTFFYKLADMVDTYIWNK